MAREPVSGSLILVKKGRAAKIYRLSLCKFSSSHHLSIYFYFSSLKSSAHQLIDFTMGFIVLAYLLFICYQTSHSRVLVQRVGTQSTLAAFMSNKNTIQLRGDGMEKAVDYRSGEVVLGISGHKSAAITMVSNYGFWGCVISEETQDCAA